MTLVKNQSLAEEITQNTFYRAMTSKKPFEQKSSELTWLCSIARRLSADEYRKNQKLIQSEEYDTAAPEKSPAETGLKKSFFIWQNHCVLLNYLEAEVLVKALLIVM